MKKKKIIYIVMFLVLSSSVFGHGENLFRLSIHLPYSYDFKNEINNFGIDANCYIVWLNIGAEYKYGNYTNQNKNSINGFIGIGLMNYIQLQYGYSTNKYSIIRLRTEWNLGDLGVYSDKLEFVDRISFKFNIDKTINRDKADWFASVGIGYSI